MLLVAERQIVKRPLQ